MDGDGTGLVDGGYDRSCSIWYTKKPYRVLSGPWDGLLARRASSIYLSFQNKLMYVCTFGIVWMGTERIVGPSRGSKPDGITRQGK